MSTTARWILYLVVGLFAVQARIAQAQETARLNVDVVRVRQDAGCRDRCCAGEQRIDGDVGGCQELVGQHHSGNREQLGPEAVGARQRLRKCPAHAR